MTEKGSDLRAQPPGVEPGKGLSAPLEADPESAPPSYEGSAVPWWLVVLFLAFIAWAIYYLVRWVPSSLREWFSGGGR
jgi:hypothetical protein